MRARWLGMAVCSGLVSCAQIAGIEDWTLESLCESDAFQCDGAILGKCIEGAWTQVADCTAPELCDSQSGKCTDVVCGAGEHRCEGADLQKCNSTQSDWELAETCASETQCNAAEGSCSGPFCTDGELACHEADLQQCDLANAEWVTLETCDSAVLCDAEAGACTTAVCSAGAHRCSANALQKCRDNLGGWDDDEVCAGPSLCDSQAGKCHKGYSCNTKTAGAGNDCGPSGIDSCCASSAIPAGSFLRSYDGGQSSDDGNPADLSAFEIDTYEVTVGRFRAFVTSGGGVQLSAPDPNAGAHPLIPGSGWQQSWNAFLKKTGNEFRHDLVCETDFHTWTDSVESGEHRPINCVTWYEAFAFCVWDGGRLPTEAEWNYAAAGGDKQREYPWGSGIDASRAVYGCMGDGTSTCAGADILNVGKKNAGLSRWGAQDLAGNVAEWTLDSWGTYPNPCTDCAVVEGTERVMRGGQFDSKPEDLRVSVRSHLAPATRSWGTGFRCAK